MLCIHEAQSEAPKGQGVALTVGKFCVVARRKGRREWLSEGAREVQAAIVPRCGGAFGGGPQSGGGPKTTVQFGPEVGQQALTDAAGNVKQGAHEVAPRIPQRIWGACDIHVRNPGDA